MRSGTTAGADNVLNARRRARSETFDPPVRSLSMGARFGAPELSCVSAIDGSVVLDVTERTIPARI
jgi:hypothetical protein